MAGRMLPGASSSNGSEEMQNKSVPFASTLFLEHLSLNDYELVLDNDLFADAVRDLVLGEIEEQDFADLLYSQYVSEQG